MEGVYATSDLYAELEYGSTARPGRQVRHLMVVRTSLRVRLAPALAVGLAAFVVYAQGNHEEMDEYAQWVTTDVDEPLTGINKEMLGG